MNKLLYPANENGTYAIPVTFRDRDNSIVSDARVESVTVSLQNREGNYIVNRTVAAVGVQSVSLSGADLRIEDQAKAQELRLFTVDAVVDDRPVHMEWEMFIKNLGVFSDVGSNIQWRNESGSSVGIYSSLTAPALDYGYACSGGVLVKATSSESTSSTPTNPTFVNQCNDGVTAWPPTSFAHLVGMPGSDDFDGVGCNSEVAGGDIWDLRGWVGSTEGSGILPAIVDSTLRLDGGSAYSNSTLTSESINHPGDFTVELPGFAMSHPASGSYWSQLRIRIGSELYYAGWEYSSGQPVGGHFFQYPGGHDSIASASEASSYKLVRTGNTIKGYYGSTQIGTGKTVSGNLTLISPYSVSYAPSTCAFDAINVVDGSGGPIYVPIEGQSCT